MAFKKLDPGRQSKPIEEFEPVGSLDSLLLVHSELVKMEKETGSADGLRRLAARINKNTHFTHVYLGHLRKLGIINFTPYARRLEIEIVLYKNVEEIVRDVYARNGYLTVWSKRGYDGEMARRFRRVKFYDVGDIDIPVVEARIGKERIRDSQTLAEWRGTELRTGEKYWMVDYHMKPKDFNMTHMKKEHNYYGKQEHADKG